MSLFIPSYPTWSTPHSATTTGKPQCRAQHTTFEIPKAQREEHLRDRCPRPASLLTIFWWWTCRVAQHHEPLSSATPLLHQHKPTISPHSSTFLSQHIALLECHLILIAICALDSLNALSHAGVLAPSSFGFVHANALRARTNSATLGQSVKHVPILEADFHLPSALGRRVRPNHSTLDHLV